MATTKNTATLKTRRSAGKKEVPPRAGRSATGKQAPALETAIRERDKVSPELRLHMIRDAAYFKAEHRGFAGDPSQYWVEAEAEIDRLLEDEHDS